MGSVAKNTASKNSIYMLCFKEKKSNLTYNSHCVSGAAGVFTWADGDFNIHPEYAAQILLPVCHIIIIWPDALIRIGELFHPK